MLTRASQKNQDQISGLLSNQIQRLESEQTSRWLYWFSFATVSAVSANFFFGGCMRKLLDENCPLICNRRRESHALCPVECKMQDQQASLWFRRVTPTLRRYWDACEMRNNAERGPLFELVDAQDNRGRLHPLTWWWPWKKKVSLWKLYKCCCKYSSVCKFLESYAEIKECY